MHLGRPYNGFICIKDRYGRWVLFITMVEMGQEDEIKFTKDPTQCERGPMLYSISCLLYFLNTPIAFILQYCVSMQ